MRIFNHGTWRGVARSRASGLPRREQRQLLRVSFWAIAAGTLAFALFRILSHDPLVALVHLITCGCALFCARRVRFALEPTLWAVGLLVVVYAYLVVFIETPGLASPGAFAWAYLMPVTSYLLLGRFLGFIVAVPFMAVIAAFGLWHLWPLQSKTDWLLLMDATAIGVLTLLFIHYYEKSRSTDYAKLQQLARTDPLTGLANRRSFLATLQRSIHEAKRSNIGFALVIMDIDHFKQVNDSFGHDVGDRVLQRVAERLMARLREADSVGRLGGEEFALILRGTTAETAYQVVEELRQRTAKRAISCGRQKVSITITSGIACWPDDTTNANELYRTADRRLYDGKRSGRNVTISAAD